MSDTKASPAPQGHLHPVTQTIEDIVQIFTELGFSVVLGQEMEDEYHNFDALNIPKDHPARDAQDTFWLTNGKLMRTHTSPVQIHYMKEHKPPFQIIAPGKVFRHEATDRTHEVQFHQIEGLAVGPDVTMANLKYYLDTFLKRIFGKELETQFRPGYFPFVEPGVEIDVRCFRCKGDGCSTCSHSGWIEILGAGMVHPQVLENVGINPREFKGFAFGLGVERIAMLRYGIDDVRLLYTGDLRVVNQF
jgi:phenylalanyl-tRNA synthetase alpha chain